LKQDNGELGVPTHTAIFHFAWNTGFPAIKK